MRIKYFKFTYNIFKLQFHLYFIYIFSLSLNKLELQWQNVGIFLNFMQSLGNGIPKNTRTTTIN